MNDRIERQRNGESNHQLKGNIADDPEQFHLKGIPEIGRSQQLVKILQSHELPGVAHEVVLEKGDHQVVARRKKHGKGQDHQQGGGK